MTLSARASTFGRIFSFEILDLRFLIDGSSNDSIGSSQNIGWNRKADLFGGFQIDHQLNLVGCSTGKSAALVPLKILSTYIAACLARSVDFIP
jgi:hypothetical protein